MSTLTPGFLASCFILSGSVRCYAPHTPVCSQKNSFTIVLNPHRLRRAPRQTGARTAVSALHSAKGRSFLTDQCARVTRRHFTLQTSLFTLHPLTFHFLSFLSFEFDSAVSGQQQHARRTRTAHDAQALRRRRQRGTTAVSAHGDDAQHTGRES